MRILNTVTLAFRALRRNKLRSALTSLGVIIGVGAVIATVSIGAGAKVQIEDRIASFGQNLVVVFPGSFSAGGVRTGFGGVATLVPEDAAAIAREIPPVKNLSPEVRSRSQILANGLNWNTQILGESPDYLDIKGWEVGQGVMFSDDDVVRIERVAAIGQTIATQLFGDESPLGANLRIGTVGFKIVAVLKSKGYNSFGQDQDDTVLIPYTTHMRQISRRTFLDSILVQASDIDHVEGVAAQVTALLIDRHHAPEGAPDFTVRNQVDSAEAATAVTDTLTAFLGSIACISLLVGGIGIMNIMLVSVTERTREIGIRLALGAHARDVLRQFLVEAVVVSLAGGILGAAMGVGGSQLLSQTKGWPVHVTAASVIGAIAFSAGIGVFFGYYPARRAASLDPIVALKYE